MVHVAQMKMTQMFLHDIKKKKENMHRCRSRKDMIKNKRVVVHI